VGSRIVVLLRPARIAYDVQVAGAPREDIRAQIRDALAA